jgi:hypothetical protein
MGAVFILCSFSVGVPNCCEDANAIGNARSDGQSFVRDMDVISIVPVKNIHFMRIVPDNSSSGELQEKKQ